MDARECSECRRTTGDIQRLEAEAKKLRDAFRQTEEPLPDNPADWLLGFEPDAHIKGQIFEIVREVFRLMKQQLQHCAQDHVTLDPH